MTPVPAREAAAFSTEGPKSAAVMGAPSAFAAESASRAAFGSEPSGSTWLTSRMVSMAFSVLRS